MSETPKVKVIRPLKSGAHTVNAFRVETIGSTHMIDLFNFVEDVEEATVVARIAVTSEFLRALFENVDLSVEEKNTMIM